MTQDAFVHWLGHGTCRLITRDLVGQVHQWSHPLSEPSLKFIHPSWVGHARLSPGLDKLENISMP